MKGNRKRMIVGILAAVSASGLAATPAAARTLATPVLGKQTGNDFRCVIYNGGRKSIEVTFEIWDPVNSVPNSRTTRTIQPERSSSIETPFGSLGTCRVEGRFPKRTTLVTFCVTPPASLECGPTVTAP